MGTKHPVQVFVDHANLLHYQHPQKVNRRIARYILTLADYNLEIHHRPGPLNHADALSHRPDYDDGKEDNQDVVPLPNSLFIEKLRSAALEALIQESYENQNEEFTRLKTIHGWEKENGKWKKDGRMAILLDQLKRDILKECHDHPIAGHPGATTTFFMVWQHYWWPRLKEYVQQYVKGCGTCQQNCEEPTTGSFRVRTKGAQDNVEQNRRGRQGGARRICPQGCRQRRGRGRRSECRVDLHLEGTTEEVNEVRDEDEGDDYQGGIGDSEDSEGEGIQVGSWLGRMHKWAV